ncbi:hypothetical protein SAMN02910339_00452 [Lachnospiraceae bacterium YSD2013]|nr:hypothetical protein SAMN02910339_00452 [Lachnospiraceae bacterium YSD2013]
MLSRIKKISETIVPLLLMTLLTFFVCKGMMEEYQTLKDFAYLKAMCVFMLLIFFERKIPARRFFTWIALGVGSVVLVTILKTHNITPELYGEIYARVLWMRYALAVTSGVILVDFFVSGQFKSFLKSINWVWYLFVLIAVSAAVMRPQDAVPLVFPMIAFLLTDIRQNRCVRLMDCLCVGYYVTFCYLFTKSIIRNPDYMDGGRYMGDFLNVGTAGMIAGSALMVGLYFTARFFMSESKKYYLLIGTGLLFVYPLYAMLKIHSRSPFLGIILASFALFAFLHGRGRKSSWRRVPIVVGGAVLMVALLYAYAFYLNARYDDGKLDDEDISYFQGHVMALTNEDRMHDSEDFVTDSWIIKGLNCFSSERLMVWSHGIRNVRLGKSQNYANAHNFFLDWLQWYGAIAGIAFIIWFLMIGIRGVKASLNNNSTAIMPILWTAFCFGIFMVTTTTWMLITSTILLIAQYPCTRKELITELSEN